MITAPPSITGASQASSICVFPAVVVTPVGASGTATGVIDVDATDEVDEPAIFVAITVKV